MKRSLAFAILLSAYIGIFAQKNDVYYDKHIIIAVDQKAAAMANKSYGNAMDLLYTALKGLLEDPSSRDGINVSMSKISSDFKFNPETDCISLFAYGIPLGRAYDNAKRDFSFEAISDALVKPRGSYYKGCKRNIVEFIGEDLKKLFKEDPLKRDFDRVYEYNGNGYGIALSHYISPIIIRYINTQVKAKEYYLLIVSDFTSTKGINDAEDRNRINELAGVSDRGNEKYKTFHIKVNDIEENYVAAEAIKIIPYGFGERRDEKYKNNINKREDFPFIFGQKLLLDACMDASVFVSSEIDFKQKELNGTSFRLAPVSITFNHNEGILLDKITFTLKDSNGKQHIYRAYEGKILESLHNSTNKTYQIPEFDNLPMPQLTEGDTLYFEYTFYTTSDSPEMKKHVALLPYIFTANRTFAVNESVFVPAPIETGGNTLYIIIVFALALLLGSVVTYWLYRIRGKKRKVSLGFSILPISNERFMEVKNNKVLNYDCWYWDGNTRNRNIHISGEYDIADKFLAKKYKYIIEFQVIDADTNEDFSFRPGIDILNSDGSYRSSGVWYEAESYSNNKFHFNANVYISEGTTPSDTKVPKFEMDNILNLKINVRVKMVDSNNRLIEYIKFNDDKGEETAIYGKFYTFIVRPKLENSNLWMAFDPGTTGSCVAYGVSSLPNANDDIHLAINHYQDVQGNWHEGVVFPSIIRVNKKSSRLFGERPAPAESLTEGVENDFVFGNTALILSKGGYGANTFQSIKKLLGYNTPQRIVSENGKTIEIPGQDLAHMLVRGLYNKVESYISNHAPDDLRAMYMQNGQFAPQRAIVAVPNNYTIVKIQEMVNSVKRMGVFKEVHYIYEAEAVIMTYLRENWVRLLEDTENMQKRIFVVYDMGGATINATAFKLKIHIDNYNGNRNIRSIDVETISKVGYCVGGDDIDYALIKMIYNAPSVKAAIAGDPDVHQKKYKSGLIEFVRSIKLDWISSSMGNTVTNTNRIEDFWNVIKANFSKKELGSVMLPPVHSDNDEKYFKNEGRNHLKMKEYVFQYVKDAVENLFSTLDANSDIELIMSGRSVLYPGIYPIVKEAINNSNAASITLWNGYNDNNGNFDSDKVKSAVATGACWYAMYSDKINIHNNVVTTSFGYIEMINGRQEFRPMIERGEKFNEHGVCKNTIDTLSKLHYVKFVQMMGMDYNNIWENNIKHKINTIDEIRSQSISTAVEKIEITIDNKNNFSYTVHDRDGVTQITKESNPFSRLTNNRIKTEIIDENSEAYTYATLNPLIENEAEAMKEEIANSRTESGRQINRNRRF